MSWATVPLSVLLAEDVSAVPQVVAILVPQFLLRLGCSQLVVERKDSVAYPGLLPSPHTHHVVGGNGFNNSKTIYTRSSKTQRTRKTY
jgi:hypothetical protein